MNIFRNLSLFCSLLLSVAVTQAVTHKELGNVNWLRNYEQAVQKSKESGKPILILFQEVPGCQGCINYGQDTLTHPLIVDAIETEFVPLAIRNNASSGHDREILLRFKEPAWNFQVMRFIDANGDDIIPRRDRVWTPAETAERMIHALEAAEKPVPEYLRSVRFSAERSGLTTAAFSMFCFWDGEAKLGGIEGVVETEAGWIDGSEVALVHYDEQQISWPTLVRAAQSHGCAKQVYAPDTLALRDTPSELTTRAKLFAPKSFRPARPSDQKRHLRFSTVNHLELNQIQKTKINAALSEKDANSILKWLSPSQRKRIM